MTRAFATAIERGSDRLHGPWRSPRNLLQAQTYGGHASVHDDETARKMGFDAAPIEGPTHFSQFIPLCTEIWGDRWLAEGCLSVSYKGAVLDGEEVMAFIGAPTGEEQQLPIWMTKRDGSEVLRGTASIGMDAPDSALQVKLDRLNAPDPHRVIFGHVEPGSIRQRFAARISFDDPMGDLYPFTLREKNANITEVSSYYGEGAKTPWGGPILPVEMISVLAHHRASEDPWLPQKNTIDLFVDQEIRVLNGPLMADTEYEVERTLVALSGSRRTESCWVRSDIYLPGQEKILASVLLNVASFKDSYADYELEQAKLVGGQ
ncbi:MAG: hypothetical protein V7676_07845 [Parasphingorhabdus sp.]|uniref:hypothetical protein n=1 Tax=Parasphingorhabdus sp. TaxID=2709688 RepID=UPI003002B19E